MWRALNWELYCLVECDVDFIQVYQIWTPDHQGEFPKVGAPPRNEVVLGRAGYARNSRCQGLDLGMNESVSILETERLVLRELCSDDAGFILRLVNEPAWLRFIGDKGIKTLEDARSYILKGPVEMYARHGFGLWLVELKEGSIAVGICGLIKRESLEDIDLGFAFIPDYWRRGYAFESAKAVMVYGKEKLRLKRIVAVMSPDNYASGRLLEKLGFHFERMVRLSDDAPEVKLYAVAV